MTNGRDIAAQLATRRGWQLLMFPAPRPADGSVRPEVARRDRWVDGVFIVGSVLVGAFFLASSWEQHSPVTIVLDVAIGMVACAALFARRRHPAAVGALVVVASAVSATASGAGIVGLFSAAIRLRASLVAALALAELAATATFPILYPSGHSFDYVQQIVIGGLINLVAVGWGLSVGLQRRYLATILRQADLVQAEQRLLATTARDAERRRIAREVHDVLAHRLSLLSVHAGALEFRPDLPPETAREMAGVIRRSSHDALQELHGAIGALRDGADESPSLHHRPGLAELDALVDQSRAAGTRIIMDDGIDELRRGEGDNEASARTVYRVVQEALTNARKHAPESPVRIAVLPAGAERVTVTVRTDQIGDTPRSSIPGSGTGLIGLAERVSIAGGEFRHESAAEEFVVEATLPWTR